MAVIGFAAPVACWPHATALHALQMIATMMQRTDPDFIDISLVWECYPNIGDAANPARAESSGIVFLTFKVSTSKLPINGRIAFLSDCPRCTRFGYAEFH
jgi:hypothetical protein